MISPCVNVVLGTLILISQAVSQHGSGGAKRSPTDSSRSKAASNVPRAEQIVLKAILADPRCAPYTIKTSLQRRVVVISGRVGSGEVHNLAVQIAIKQGYPFRDDLTVDTSLAARVRADATKPETQGRQLSPTPRSSPSASASRPNATPSLLRSGDDELFETEPPLVRFPHRSNEPRPRQDGSVAASSKVQSDSAPSSNHPAQSQSNATSNGGQLTGGPIANGRVRITVYGAGQVYLDGVVASEDESLVDRVRSFARPWSHSRHQ